MKKCKLIIFQDDYEIIINGLYFIFFDKWQNEELGSLIFIPTNLIKDYSSNSFFISSLMENFYIFQVENINHLL